MISVLLIREPFIQSNGNHKLCCPLSQSSPGITLQNKPDFQNSLLAKEKSVQKISCAFFPVRKINILGNYNPKELHEFLIVIY